MTRARKAPNLPKHQADGIVKMPAAPWDRAQSHEQLFVLITGANSGVGLGTAERLIDEFLASRSLSSHLILVPTTRSVAKSRETIESLRAYLRNTAARSRTLTSRAGHSYSPQDTIDRVHLLSVQLDLCNLRNVHEVAAQLVHGTVTDPTDPSTPRYRIPRLDAVVLNAGIGGWTGLNWAGLTYSFFVKGLMYMATYPDYKLARSGAVVRQSVEGADACPPVLGEIFCANVFGHYVLAHELLPLLSRDSEKERPARIIWTSSIEADAISLNLDDFQGIESKVPYENSKRITDILALTSHLPSVRKYVNSYFQADDDDDDDDNNNNNNNNSSSSSSSSNDDASEAEVKPVPPAMYVTHPGIVHSTLMPLPFFLVNLYWFALLMCRWLGSPWHVVDGYRGGAASVWMVLEDQETLEELEAHKVKWGSCCNFMGTTGVKKTEVEGWGWEGKAEDRESLAKDPALGVLRKLKGRRPEAQEPTLEDLAGFEELGISCWKEMERLRLEWQGILRAGTKSGAADEKI
ncbi:hypothetical protein SODALDRAFT_380625 [Sodiomyces alkalinus F11]|uniref:3-ketosteroid reductase n=1 Tax=Sodiomyces alkalinus (strain CBS 110278 / VKM F-3762 / F11) TaxID=1314773 RepID=A0A3N2PP41_SODAK|nr:hypothetical protein SODALDRAFT_380625 [Sodiomyces alkalinus F11]ROT36291.1 hypothetical protein SODALDRAFT_380625 [Sodiomyces alkalinus F11]